MKDKEYVEWLLSCSTEENEKLQKQLSDKEISFDMYKDRVFMNDGIIIACKLILQID